MDAWRISSIVNAPYWDEFDRILAEIWTGDADAKAELYVQTVKLYEKVAKSDPESHLCISLRSSIAEQGIGRYRLKA